MLNYAYKLISINIVFETRSNKIKNHRKDKKNSWIKTVQRDLKSLKHSIIQKWLTYKWLNIGKNVVKSKKTLFNISIFFITSKRIPVHKHEWLLVIEWIIHTIKTFLFTYSSQKHFSITNFVSNNSLLLTPANHSFVFNEL